jgi:Sep-tRNA:Cys-tRNA synthetase
MIINKYKGFVIINPLMRGGIIPEDARKNLLDWTDVGYINCHDCIEGRSSLVSSPPINKFLKEIAEFFGGDEAEHTFGCRAAQFSVMKAVRSLVDNGEHTDIIVSDPLSHYSTNIAAEMNGLKVAEPSHSGFPEYLLEADLFREKIEEVKKQTGKLPALVVVTHADPYYGNIAPVEEIGNICNKYEVPYMVNAAYTAGVIPIDMKKIKADFLTVSAHKSMSSLAPLGFLVTNFVWKKEVFATSQDKPDWSGRVFGKKIPNIFGCSIGGLPLISCMLSFPFVKKRVKLWNSELENINLFIKEMENLGDVMLLGQRPHMHHLLHFETPLFWELSKNYSRGGFFLAKELKKRNIVGVQKGMTKHIKLSIYGMSNNERQKVLDAFYEIAHQRESVSK